jgi:hypothetical protein
MVDPVVQGEHPLLLPMDPMVVPVVILVAVGVAVLLLSQVSRKATVATVPMVSQWLYNIFKKFLMAKNNTVLVVGIAAAAAAVWYFFIRPGAQAAPGSAATPGAAALPGGPAVNSTGPVYTSPPTPASNVNTDMVVQGWMNTLDAANKEQALGQFGNMTVDEKNQLADIIQNVWAVGAKPSAVQTNFWNAWRVKYHILDGTYA